jgi:hypothetical protein
MSGPETRICLTPRTEPLRIENPSGTEVALALLRELVLVLLQAVEYATLPGRNIFAELLSVLAAGLFPCIHLSFQLLHLPGDVSAALRRELGFVLLQTGEDAATSGLDAFAEFFHVRGASVLLSFSGTKTQSDEKKRKEDGE